MPPPVRWPQILSVRCSRPDALHPAQMSTPIIVDEYRTRPGVQLTPPLLRHHILQQLAHVPGSVMWDVGAGSGAIAIEWKIARPDARVIAIEHDIERCEDIAYNAFVRKVHVDILHADGAAMPAELPRPDMIWHGCPGESGIDLFPDLWERLLPLGWMASNAVSAMGVERMQSARARYGGLVTVHAGYDPARHFWVVQKT